MPGAVNLLLRSIDWPPADAPPPGAMGAPAGWAPGWVLGWAEVVGAAEPGVVTSGRGPAAGGAAGVCAPTGGTPPETGGVPVGWGPKEGMPVGFGAVGVWMPPVEEETGGVKAGLAPGAPTGALEIVPSPGVLLGRSNAPFAAPGAVNLLLRSVD